MAKKASKKIPTRSSQMATPSPSRPIEAREITKIKSGQPANMGLEHKGETASSQHQFFPVHPQQLGSAVSSKPKGEKKVISKAEGEEVMATTPSKRPHEIKDLPVSEDSIPRGRKRGRKVVPKKIEQEVNEGESENLSAPPTPLLDGRDGREPKRRRTGRRSRKEVGEEVQEASRTVSPVQLKHQVVISYGGFRAVEVEFIDGSAKISRPAPKGIMIYATDKDIKRIRPIFDFGDLAKKLVRKIFDLLHEGDNPKPISSVCFGLTSRDHWELFKQKWCSPGSNMIYQGYLSKQDEALLAPLLYNWVPEKYRMMSGMGGMGGASFVPMFLSRKEYGEGYTREEEKLEKRYNDCVSILDATNLDGLQVKSSRGLHALIDNTIDLPNPYGMGHSWYDAAASEYLYLVETWEHSTFNGDGPGFEAICESWHSFQKTGLWDWVNGKGFNQFQEDWMNDEDMEGRKVVKKTLVEFGRTVRRFESKNDGSIETGIIERVEDMSLGDVIDSAPTPPKSFTPSPTVEMIKRILTKWRVGNPCMPLRKLIVPTIRMSLFGIRAHSCASHSSDIDIPRRKYLDPDRRLLSKCGSCHFAPGTELSYEICLILEVDRHFIIKYTSYCSGCWKVHIADKTKKELEHFPKRAGIKERVDRMMEELDEALSENVEEVPLNDAALKMKCILSERPGVAPGIAFLSSWLIQSNKLRQDLRIKKSKKQWVCNKSRMDNMDLELWLSYHWPLWDSYDD
ncbi:hypothetical protein NHQ30_011530 [Ciborinia camelliae]|nr:hypothetical protein NHQ30_011530 [Ciborinia camelliae]